MERRRNREVSSGAKEAARCRASFKKRGAESYVVDARCASASGKVEQTALLTYVGGNQFTGSFFNEEYKVDGTITVTVSGNSQNVSISSPAGVRRRSGLPGRWDHSGQLEFFSGLNLLQEQRQFVGEVVKCAQGARFQFLMSRWMG